MACYRLTAAALCLALTASCAAEPGAGGAPQENAQAARQARSLFDPDLHMRTADVRVGMKGYGLSVFKGTAIERFEVEVLAVLRNSEQIDTDVVLISATGANLEHTGPIAGMSGSPIYITCDDGRQRLLGAFAFGWPGMKDPMAGVQPIEAMLELDPTPRPEAPAPRAALESSSATLDLVSARAIGKLLEERPASLAELFGHVPASSPAGRLAPLAIPLSSAGLSKAATGMVSDALGGFGMTPTLPVDARLAGGASQADRIEPGGTLIIPMLIGDLNLVATGTCTTVIGDQVFGFGHPMFGDGRSSLPMAAGVVDAVIPTQEVSFKLGSPGKVVGTLATDAVAGVAGTIGPVPDMIPVSIAVRRGAESQTFRFQVARHQLLTAVLLGAAAQDAIAFRGAPETDGATRWDATVRYSGGRTLRLQDTAANNDPFFGGGFVGSVVLPLQALQDNPFERVKLEALEAQVELLDASQVQMVRLEEMSLPRRSFKPGETVKVNLVFRRHRGERVEHVVELELPDDLEPGEYPLSVSDSATALQAVAEARPFEFEVRSIDELFSVINAAQSFGSGAVYLRLDRPEDIGVAVGRQAMPELPGSRALLLAESGRSDVTVFSPAVSRKVDLPFVLTEGEAQAVITIKRP